MSNFVFVIDANFQPLNPVHPGEARRLLNTANAAVYRRYPFTIIMKTVVPSPEVKGLQLKIDPGSKVSGLALVQGDKVIWGAQLTHRGQQIKNALTSRRSIRKSRRNRKTWYRQSRFSNRKRTSKWLPPSLMHRVLTIMTWVKRIMRFAPITGLSQELAKFDTQLQENPEISGIEYQQGVLAGYEIRQYILEKWDRECTYCGARDMPLQIDHIHPRSKGGSDRVSNLCLACQPCNLAKGNQNIRDFLCHKPDLLNRIMMQAKASLKDAAAVNATRSCLFHALKETGIPVTTGTGGQTKYNRTRLLIPKTHWLDAACVGEIDSLEVCTQKPLLIFAKGRGSRQMCITNRYGIPIRHRSRSKVVDGFQTGDIVRATLPQGKFAGVHVGRLITRASGVFELVTKTGKVSPVRHKYCSSIQRSDGYNYAF